MLHIIRGGAKIAVDRILEYRCSNPSFDTLRPRGIHVPHAFRRMRKLIRAMRRHLPFSGRLLPIQVLECGIGSGKMRVLQLSLAKELDSANRLSANFSRGAT
jgi:hypothetical protein